MTSVRYYIQIDTIDRCQTEPGSLWISNDVPLSCDHSFVTFITHLAAKKDQENELQEQTLSLPLDGALKRIFRGLTEEYFNLLFPVKTDSRTALLEDEGFLDWASRLQPETRLQLKINSGATRKIEASGVLRYIGSLKGYLYGTMFGVELDCQFAGMGTSDGSFRKVYYFRCGDDCGVFVSVAMLVRQTEPIGASSAVDRLPPYTVDRSDTVPSHAARLYGMPDINLSNLTVGDDVVKNCRLVLGDRIVWMSDNGAEFGDVKWIGFLPDYMGPRVRERLTVGVSFDNPIGSGTGRYKSSTLFEAPRGHASLVPIVGLMKAEDLGVGDEDQFGSQHKYRTQGSSPAAAPYAFRESPPSGAALSRQDSATLPDRRTSPQPVITRAASQSSTRAVTDFALSPPLASSSPNAAQQSPLAAQQHQVGEQRHAPPATLTLKGRVLPPSIADVEWLCGKDRGIQAPAKSDRATLESLVLALFAFYSHFDDQLFSKQTGGRQSLTDSVRTVLVEYIVNPIRRSPYVSSDKISRFGELLSMIDASQLTGVSTTIVTLKTDITQLVTVILKGIVNVQPLFSAVDNDGTETVEEYAYVVDSLETAYPAPSLQHLLECSVAYGSARRLVRAPRSVFVVGVGAKLAGGGTRIFPTLVLDTAGLLRHAGVPCAACGENTATTGAMQCGDCFRQESTKSVVTDALMLASFTYCPSCSGYRHHRADRQNHQPHPLAAVNTASDYDVDSGVPTKMDLYAVISMIGGHYVTFFKAGGGASAEWLTFDAMAGKNTDGTFSSEIKRCPEIAEWLDNVQKARNSDKMPDIIRKLADGLRLCFYQPQTAAR